MMIGHWMIRPGILQLIMNIPFQPVLTPSSTKEEIDQAILDYQRDNPTPNYPKPEIPHTTHHQEWTSYLRRMKDALFQPAINIYIWEHQDMFAVPPNFVPYMAYFRLFSPFEDVEWRRVESIHYFAISHSLLHLPFYSVLDSKKKMSGHVCVMNWLEWLDMRSEVDFGKRLGICVSRPSNVNEFHLLFKHAFRISDWQSSCLFYEHSRSNSHCLSIFLLVNEAHAKGAALWWVLSLLERISY